MIVARNVSLIKSSYLSLQGHGLTVQILEGVFRDNTEAREGKPFSPDIKVVHVETVADEDRGPST